MQSLMLMDQTGQVACDTESHGHDDLTTRSTGNSSSKNDDVGVDGAMTA